MPPGVPKIGNPTVYQTKNPKLSSEAEELLNAPKPELIGTIPQSTLEPSASVSQWSEGGVPVELSEPPPPWEVDPKYFKHDTDARRFVDVPDNWVLRWINPRMIDRHTWRDWEPVMASDPRVKVKVRQLVGVDNNIRRGRDGDILAWMWRGWWESKLKLKAETVRRRTQSARDRQDSAREAVSRGLYDHGHGYTRIDSAIHPTHTIGEGRSMKE